MSRHEEYIPDFSAYVESTEVRYLLISRSSEDSSLSTGTAASGGGFVVPHQPSVRSSLLVPAKRASLSIQSLSNPHTPNNNNNNNNNIRASALVDYSNKTWNHSAIGIDSQSRDIEEKSSSPLTPVSPVPLVPVPPVVVGTTNYTPTSLFLTVSPAVLQHQLQQQENGSDNKKLEKDFISPV